MTPETPKNLPQDLAPALSTMLDMAGRAMAIVDAQGDLIRANAAFRGALGGAEFTDAERLRDILATGRASGIVATTTAGVPVHVDVTPLDESAGLWLLAIAQPKDEIGGGDPLDPLTGLPNKSFVAARLQRLLAETATSEKLVTVICLDIDQFDAINQAHGRVVGDSVLMEVTRRIGRNVRGSNIVGRLIEDCFIVVVPDLSTEDQVNAIAQRLVGNISQPFQAPGVTDPILISASAGVALAPENGMDAAALIAAAEAAVDYAKSTGRGTYQFFTNHTGNDVRERRSQISRLHRGIENEELFLQYQPKISLVTGSIVGAEALVRWQDPSSGLVMPADFIPMAEDAGLMDPIGRMVLETTCRTIRSWSGDDMPFLRLAANVSARQLARRGFYDDLRAIIDNSGIDAERLELEITESAVLDNSEDIIRTVGKVRELGVHLTADDFGTGYASLSYLRHFPLDGIKIDVAFVNDIDAAEGNGGLAAAVVAIGHSLGMNVVAEGVETQTQLDFLRWRNCDEVQGYLLCEPVSADALEDMVRADWHYPPKKD